MNNSVSYRQESIKKAIRRGDMTLQNWIKDGTLIKSDSLSLAWSLSIQEVEILRQNGKIFSLHIDGQNYYPELIKHLSLENVIKINEAFDNSVEPSDKIIFLMRKHGSLGGKTVNETVNENLDQIIGLAKNWHID